MRPPRACRSPSSEAQPHPHPTLRVTQDVPSSEAYPGPLQGRAKGRQGSKHAETSRARSQHRFSSHLHARSQLIRPTVFTVSLLSAEYSTDPAVCLKNKRSFYFNYQIDRSICSSRRWAPQRGTAGRHGGWQGAAEPGRSHGPRSPGELLRKGDSSGLRRFRAHPGPGTAPAGLS